MRFFWLVCSVFVVVDFIRFCNGNWEPDRFWIGLMLVMMFFNCLRWASDED